jgi:hypothetical protein
LIRGAGGGVAADDDYVALHHKHNFTLSHMGMLLGMLYTNLRELRVHGCNDFMSCDTASMTLIASLPQLRSLHIEDIQVRVKVESIGELGRLRMVDPCRLSLKMVSARTVSVKMFSTRMVSTKMVSTSMVSASMVL